MATQFDGDVVIAGALRVGGALPTLLRTNLQQESYSDFEIPITRLRVWDAFQTIIATAASDDLGIAAGVFATGTPYVTAGSLGTAGSTTRYARFMFQMPMNYVAAAAARLSFLAGITGGTPVAASVSCTMDAEAFKVGADTLISGTDVVSTAASSINVTTFANTAFDLTATSISPGDWFDCRIAIICNDGTASAGNVVPAITKIKLQCHTKG